MPKRTIAIWTAFICIVSAIRTGHGFKEPTDDPSREVHAGSSSAVVYCQPPPTMPAPNGAEHSSNGQRRTSAPRTMKGHIGKVQQHDYATDGNENGHAYEKDGKYWLVPPFLIGASSIVVIYVFVHCMYTHCNCGNDKQRRRRRGVPGGAVPIRRVQISTATGMTAGGGKGPTFVLSDAAGSGGPATGTSGSRLVPLVCYDDVSASSAVGGGAATGNSGLGPAYGRTQLVEAQPFLIYEQCDDSLDYYEEQPSTPRKGSGFLQLPAAIGRRLSQARLSFSSIGRGSHGRDREPRASICFVPVARTISDPSGVPGDGLVNGGLGCSGQSRFEGFYCRSCGNHNVVDVGRSLASRVTTKSPPPEGDGSTACNENRVDTDLPSPLSSQPPQSSVLTLPVPMILVDDDTSDDVALQPEYYNNTDTREGDKFDSTVVMMNDEH